MTKEQAIKYKDVLDALREGKPIQYKLIGVDVNWLAASTNPQLHDDRYEFRVAPTPTYRPWKPEEVPVGALVRRKLKPEKEVVILGVSCSKPIDAYLILSSELHAASNHYLSDMLTYHGGHTGDMNEHSTDQGKTWQPCGVKE